jgi:hypothetical protein
VRADRGQASPERVNHRNDYRHRDLDTRVGTIDVAVPQLRTGSYVPSGTGTGRYCGSRSPRRRRIRRGTRSSRTWSPAAWPGCGWPPPTPTPAWSRRSQRTCPGRAGNAAAPTGTVKNQVASVGGPALFVAPRTAAALGNRVGAGVGW